MRGLSLGEGLDRFGNVRLRMRLLTRAVARSAWVKSGSKGEDALIDFNNDPRLYGIDPALNQSITKRRMQMPTTERQPASLVPWLLVAVLGFMLWQRTPMPKPEPEKSDARAVAAKMIDDTAKGYAGEFNRAATQVEAKEIVNEEQLHKQLKEKLDGVRSAASADLDGLMDTRIPTEFDDGNRGAVVTFLRLVANGFQ